MSEAMTRGWAPESSAMAPMPYRVRSKVVENADSVTLCLEPVATELSAPRPGSS